MKIRLLTVEEIADLDRDVADDQMAAVVRDSADPKALLKTVVGRITLDPDTMACQIHGMGLPASRSARSSHIASACPIPAEQPVLAAICFPRWATQARSTSDRWGLKRSYDMAVLYKRTAQPSMSLFE